MVEPLHSLPWVHNLGTEHSGTNRYLRLCHVNHYLFSLTVMKALADAGLKYTDVEQAVVGYCYGEDSQLMLSFKLWIICMIIKY